MAACVEIAAEFGQQRAFLGPVGGHFLRLRPLRFPRAPWKAAIRAHAGFRRRNISLRAAVRAADARFRCACGSAARPPPLRTPARACIRGSAADRPTWRPSRGWWCAPSICLRMESTDALRAQKPVGQRFIFAQQAEQQMLGLDVRAAELAGLVAREKNHPAGLLCITFKHVGDLRGGQ